MLQPRAALTLGVAAHDLTTNAVKYGALSVPEGNIKIDWTVAEDADRRQLVLKWVERNGPPVTPPEHRGFGMTLIERGFSYDVGAEARINFQLDGVIATLVAPLSGTQRRELL